ncbi:major facilitator transporter [Novosphingobium nitrogenifigens DSM 19370]|uniref:Multidrug efflux pump Tap n=1 Tax=Novosphingobium nitrogenifigens DSM 19370 TaxID=983920 RepID=F1Z9D3_9SPHN|nr:major facilitator transporter [Novosphingobium nitrogenifigens DSM 19370]
MTDSAAPRPSQDLPASPLAIPDYRRYWLARFTSVFATSGMVVVLGYQLYDIARGSYGMSIKAAAFQLGVLGLVQFLPQILFAPIAGVIADRFDRRNVTALATMIDLVIALVLTAATALGALNLPLLFALGALHGTARSFIGPAQSSIAPNIVPAALMPRAIAISSMAWQTGAVSGPALAGILFAVMPSLPYALSSVLLAIATISIFRIRPVPPPPGNADTHPLRQIVEGMTYVGSDRFLLGCVTLDLFAVLLGGATALLPVYARDILTWHGQPVGSYGLGIMRAMPSLGAAAVGLVLARRPIEREVGAKMLLAVAAYGIATAAFGLSRDFILSLGLLAALGAADMISVFIRNALVQLHVPDALRGRVSAISGLAISASNELGEMESGLAAALLGATGAVVFGGVGAVVVTVLWTIGFPELRRVRTFAVRYADE